MDMVALPFYAYLKSTKKPPAKKYCLNPQSIGEHMRKKRIEDGLLQRDVAKLLDASEDTITGWENGRYLPIISFYPKIIDFLQYYPFDHPIDTAEGLIERCRHTLGLSYDNLGVLVGTHGSTLIHYAQSNVILNRHIEKGLRQLLHDALPY